MSSVSAIQSVPVDPSTIGAAYHPGSSRVPGKNLGEQDFLKLLTVQLANQDPQQPMDNNAFIGQMAQFSSLQQTSSLVTQFSQVKANSDLSTASSLLGKQVTVTDSKAATGKTTGTVSAIDASSGTPQILINGIAYPLSSLQRIEPVIAPAA